MGDELCSEGAVDCWKRGKRKDDKKVKQILKPFFTACAARDCSDIATLPADLKNGLGK